MKPDDIRLASQALQSFPAPAHSGSTPAIDPKHLGLDPSLSRELRQAILMRPGNQPPPLEMTWQEQASLVQRIGLNKNRGERLGPPMPDSDGKYTFPIYDRSGNIIGGATVYRERDVLKGGFAKESSGIDANAEFVQPTVAGAYRGGKAIENDPDGNGFKAADKIEMPSLESGGKVYAKGAAIEVNSGSFSINPDGSGRGYAITTGGIKGEMAAKAMVNMNLEGKKPSVGMGVGGEANAQLMASSLKVEAFGPVKPTSDPNSCTQITASGEGGAQIGLGGSAMANIGTDGVKAKVSAAMGPGLSGGFSAGRPSLECKVENQIIGGGSEPLSSNGSPEASALRNDFLNGVATSSGPNQFLTVSQRTSIADAPTNVDQIPLQDFATPKYGNYCGPSWIGGMYDNGNVCRVEWKPPVDKLDEACREHDYAYIRGDVNAQTPNTNPDKQEADLRLLDRSNEIDGSELDPYGGFYRFGVQEVFGYKTGSQGTIVGLDNAWQGLKDTVGDAWDATVNLTGEALRYASDRADEAVDAISSQLDRAADSVLDGAASIRESVIAGYDILADTLSDLAKPSEEPPWEGQGGASSGAGASGSWAQAPEGFGGDAALGAAGGDQPISALSAEAEGKADEADASAARADGAARRADSALRRAQRARARILARLRRR